MRKERRVVACDCAITDRRVVFSDGNMMDALTKIGASFVFCTLDKSTLLMVDDRRKENSFNGSRYATNRFFFLGDRLVEKRKTNARSVLIQEVDGSYRFFLKVNDNSFIVKSYVIRKVKDSLIIPSCISRSVISKKPGHFSLKRNGEEIIALLYAHRNSTKIGEGWYPIKYQKSNLILTHNDFRECGKTLGVNDEALDSTMLVALRIKKKSRLYNE
jgi:hypothetical protein